MRQNVADREFLRKRVKIFLEKNSTFKQSEVVTEFVRLGYARRSVYNVLSKLTTDQPIKDRKRTGRPTSWTASSRGRLKRLVNNRTGVSQRRLAQKFRVSHMTIGRQLAKMSIRCRKREKTPKYDEKQQQKSQELSRRLYTQLRDANCDVIIDDEKYFTFSGHHMPANARYYSDDVKTCPESVRFAGYAKYPDKVMVWIAISERGISQPTFRRQKSEAVTAAIYIRECLNKRLLPFIHKYHPDANYIFWPDLASAHYAKDTVEWMNANIKFVPKNINPPNVPQARPIENFWGCLAQKVYEGGWEATTEEQLIRRIAAKLNEFTNADVKKLMGGLKAKLKKIGDHGVHSLFDK